VVVPLYKKIKIENRKATYIEIIDDLPKKQQANRKFSLSIS
jgi:hypothetical protein